MSLEIKAGAVTEGLPQIQLAGVPYFVAKLPLRARIAIATLAPKVKAILERFPSKEALEAGAVVNIPEEDYLLLVEIARHGLATLYPTITRDDLLNEPIDFDELFAAYPVIINQGMSRRARETGEATATNPSTGEGSSPT